MNIFFQEVKIIHHSQSKQAGIHLSNRLILKHSGKSEIVKFCFFYILTQWLEYD